MMITVTFGRRPLENIQNFDSIYTNLDASGSTFSYKRSLFQLLMNQNKQSKTTLMQLKCSLCRKEKEKSKISEKSRFYKNRIKASHEP